MKTFNDSTVNTQHPRRWVFCDKQKEYKLKYRNSEGMWSRSRILFLSMSCRRAMVEVSSTACVPCQIRMCSNSLIMVNNGHHKIALRSPGRPLVSLKRLVWPLIQTCHIWYRKRSRGSMRKIAPRRIFMAVPIVLYSMEWLQTPRDLK